MRRASMLATLLSQATHAPGLATGVWRRDDGEQHSAAAAATRPAKQHRQRMRCPQHLSLPSENYQTAYLTPDHESHQVVAPGR